MARPPAMPRAPRIARGLPFALRPRDRGALERVYAEQNKQPNDHWPPNLAGRSANHTVRVTRPPPDRVVWHPQLSSHSCRDRMYMQRGHDGCGVGWRRLCSAAVSEAKPAPLLRGCCCDLRRRRSPGPCNTVGVSMTIPIVEDVFRRLTGASTLCIGRRTLPRDSASLSITSESAIVSGQRSLVRSHPTW